MRHGRIDNNQRDLVRQIRKIPGCTVQSLADCGAGVPDLLIGYNGKCYLAEIKDGSKPPSKRKLTPDQIRWHNAWHGQVAVVTNIQQVYEMLGIC